jgi:zinc transport system ATP-binding protein
MAMALEPMPNILILDEPMSGVDVAGERQLLEMLDELRTKYDLSILLSTHDFNTLHQVDKVILLKHQVLSMGTPEQVMESEPFNQLFTPGYGKGGSGK